MREARATDPTNLALWAERVLRRNDKGGWTRAAPDLYPHQWSWDTGFIAVGIAHVDTGRAARELSSLFEHQWTNGKVPHIVFNPEAPPGSYFPGAEHWSSAGAFPDAPPAPPYTSALCQPPTHAIGALRVWELARERGETDAAGGFLRETTTLACSPGTATWPPPATPRARGWSPSTTPGRAAPTTPRGGTQPSRPSR